MNDDSFNLYHFKAVSAVLFLFADGKEEIAENQDACIRFVDHALIMNSKGN